MLLTKIFLSFSIALLCVYAFRYLEHVKCSKGVLWSVLRITGAVLFLFAIVRFGEFLQLPISELNIAYDPNNEKPLFNGFAVSISYFLMVLFCLGSAVMVEPIFFKRYLTLKASEERSNSQPTK